MAKIAAIAGVIVAATAPASANSKYAGIIVDAKTGKTLYASNADAPRYPASLTKIMTLYVLFEEMEAGRISLNTRMKVSKYAAARPPTKLGLKPGSRLLVKDAILGLVTKSANDAASVIAEHISGSERAFARRMTQTAHQLGMTRTTFRNPHGLPNSKQRTTARDMATLGRAIQERFPTYFKYFKTRSFTYRGRRMGNHNKLLGRVKGVDGIKTGYTNASGFNLVTNVERDGRHIVGVVMGGRTGRSRDAQMVKLINQYIKKASRGPKTVPAIASAAPRRSFRAADLKVVPLPSGKPGAVVLASAPQVAETPAPVPAPQVATAPAVRVAPQAPAPQTALALAKPESERSDPTELVTGAVPVPQSQVESRLASAFDVARLAPIPQTAPGNPALVKTKATAKVTMVDVVQPSGKTITPAKASLPEVASAPAKEIAKPAKETVAIATSDSAEKEAGWQVQIAAAESETGAIDMLKKAKSKTGKALHKRTPYTEPVQANGQTLYRARFVGFETKTAALRACKTLKQAKFACYAIYQ